MSSKENLVDYLDELRSQLYTCSKMMHESSINEDWARKHPAMQQHAAELAGAAGLIDDWIEALLS